MWYLVLVLDVSVNGPVRAALGRSSSQMKSHQCCAPACLIAWQPLVFSAQLGYSPYDHYLKTRTGFACCVAAMSRLWLIAAPLCCTAVHLDAVDLSDRQLTGRGAGASDRHSRAAEAVMLWLMAAPLYGLSSHLQVVAELCFFSWRSRFTRLSVLHC